MPDSCNPSSHLVPLADGWSLWRTTCLRGTGFPVDLLEKLVPQGLEVKIELLLDCDRDYRKALDEALELSYRLKKVCAKEARTEWQRALKKLRKGRAPGAFSADPEAAKLFAELSTRIEAREAAQLALSEAYPAAREEVTGNLKELCDMPLFREAILWQNRAFVKTGLDAFKNRDVTQPNRKTRVAERKIASYLQRYCGKNESIGFFGPVGWAEIAPTPKGLDLRPGPGLVSKRLVTFEHWAIDSLTQKLSEDDGILSWMLPRQHTNLRLHGDHYLLSSGEEGDLDPVRRRVLDVCDGLTPAREIANRLAGESAFPVGDASEVLQVLRGMRETGLIIWRVEAVNRLDAEQDLRGRLEKIGDQEIRNRALEIFGTLVDAKNQVAAAAGDPEALDEAMEGLEQVFSRLTGMSPERFQGRVYAGRTLVFEDCRRDIEATVDEKVLAPIRDPLVPVLEATRWYSHEVSRNFKTALEALHDQACEKNGTETVDLSALWPEIFELSRKVAAKVGSELEKRLMQLLPFAPGERQVEFDPAKIRAASAELFAAPGPGWSSARRHSPDIMIAAESPEAIGRGDALFILGEIHTCRNTVMQPVILSMHPDPERAIAADRLDRASFGLAAANPPGLGGSRASIDYTHNPDDYHLCDGESVSWMPPEKILRIGDMVLEKGASGLRLRSRDGSQDLGYDDFVGCFIRYWSPKNYSLKPVGRHIPRMNIGRLVFCRETWRFEPDEIDFACLDLPEERYVAARRWQVKHGLPRRIFVKSPQENKPIYIDFHSPVCIELLAHSVRQADEKKPGEPLTLSEMLPTPEQSWLRDSAGNRYTSELRIVAVDPVCFDDVKGDKNIGAADAQISTSATR